MTSIESTTPRTDAEERWAEWNGNEFKCVHVEFARELERELNALRKNAERYRWLREQPSFVGWDAPEHMDQAIDEKISSAVIETTSPLK